MAVFIIEIDEDDEEIVERSTFSTIHDSSGVLDSLEDNGLLTKDNTEEPYEVLEARQFELQKHFDDQYRAYVEFMATSRDAIPLGNMSRRLFEVSAALTKVKSALAALKPPCSSSSHKKEKGSPSKHAESTVRRAKSSKAIKKAKRKARRKARRRHPKKRHSSPPVAAEMTMRLRSGACQSGAGRHIVNESKE